MTWILFKYRHLKLFVCFSLAHYCNLALGLFLLLLRCCCMELRIKITTTPYSQINRNLTIHTRLWSCICCFLYSFFYLSIVSSQSTNWNGIIQQNRNKMNSLELIASVCVYIYIYVLYALSNKAFCLHPSSYFRRY